MLFTTIALDIFHDSDIDLKGIWNFSLSYSRYFTLQETHIVHVIISFFFYLHHRLLIQAGDLF